MHFQIVYENQNIIPPKKEELIRYLKNQKNLTQEEIDKLEIKETKYVADDQGLKFQNLNETNYVSGNIYENKEDIRPFYDCNMLSLE